MKDDSRETDGRFARGNQAAKGHGGRHKIALLREAALEVATPEMAQAAFLELYRIGTEDHDVKAICEFLNRCGVKAEAVELEAQILELREVLEGLETRGGVIR